MLWIIDATLLAIAVMLVAGFVARRRLRWRYPAPGRLIKVGPQMLHLDARGNQGPTVPPQALVEAIESTVAMGRGQR